MSHVSARIGGRPASPAARAGTPGAFALVDDPRGSRPAALVAGRTRIHLELEGELVISVGPGREIRRPSFRLAATTPPLGGLEERWAAGEVPLEPAEPRAAAEEPPARARPPRVFAYVDAVEVKARASVEPCGTLGAGRPVDRSVRAARATGRGAWAAAVGDARARSIAAGGDGSFEGLAWDLAFAFSLGADSLEVRVRLDVDAEMRVVTGYVASARLRLGSGAPSSLRDAWAALLDIGSSVL